MPQHPVLADPASFIKRLWLDVGGSDGPEWRWLVQHIQSGWPGDFSGPDRVVESVAGAAQVTPAEYVAPASREQGDREAVVRFLEQHAAMTVAATGPHGTPWATPVFYVNDGLRLYWLGSPRSRLGACLEANPRAAATIIGPAPAWHLMQGIQVEGRVSLVSSWKEYFRCARLFVRKFPGFSRQLVAGASAHRVRDMAQRRFYVLESERLWFTDHSRGFGARVELDCR